LRNAGAIPPLVTILGRATVDRTLSEEEVNKAILYSLWVLTNMATNG